MNRGVIKIKYGCVILEQGIDTASWKTLVQKRRVRFYPFEEDLFFWTWRLQHPPVLGTKQWLFCRSASFRLLYEFMQPVRKNASGSTEYRPEKSTRPVQKTIKLVSTRCSLQSHKHVAGIEDVVVLIHRVRVAVQCTGRASTRSSRAACSSRSTPRSAMVWQWASQSAVPSSSCTADDSRFRQCVPARPSISLCDANVPGN